MAQRLPTQQEPPHVDVAQQRGNRGSLRDQPTPLQDSEAIDFSSCQQAETRDKEHGRVEQRLYGINDIRAGRWDGNAGMYGGQRAIRIEHGRLKARTGVAQIEVSCALASLRPERAPAEADRGLGPRPLAQQEPPALRSALRL